MQCVAWCGTHANEASRDGVSCREHATAAWGIATAAAASRHHNAVVAIMRVQVFHVGSLFSSVGKRFTNYIYTLLFILLK